MVVADAGLGSVDVGQQPSRGSGKVHVKGGLPQYDGWCRQLSSEPDHQQFDVLSGLRIWRGNCRLTGKVTRLEDPSKSAIDALASVFDPCCRDRGISILDMGLVSSMHVERGKASVELILTSGWCPFAARVLGQVKEKLEALPEIRHAEVRVVWDQPWTMDRLSENARNKLRFLPDPAQVQDRQGYIAGHLGRERASERSHAVRRRSQDDR